MRDIWNSIREEVPLRPLLDDMIAKISLKTSKKRVEFTTVYHRCEMVYADAFCLREVLGNLLDNAIKYSHEEVKIDIICESEKGFCKIKVCDNGFGYSLKKTSLLSSTVLNVLQQSGEVEGAVLQVLVWA